MDDLTTIELSDDTREKLKNLKKIKLSDSTRKALKSLKKIELSDNSRQVIIKRYLRKGEDGKPIETIEQMFYRVASTIASPEFFFNGDFEQTFVSFVKMLINKEFFPNSPTFTGAGTPLGQLAACFVLLIKDDMGRDPQGIFSTLRHAALIQQTGGGNGFCFSRLRQKGALVKTSCGSSTGPVGFMKVYDQAFGVIAQGGTRRGANMAVLRVDHPDIREFITCKKSESDITNFNISVGITDEFMEAVRENRNYNLIAPHTKEVIESVNAREIFDLIVECAHRNGEPGVLFLKRANEDNPVPHLYKLESTNPCGEQFLGPYENCCLGSINLAKHLDEKNGIDWLKLKKTTVLATKFLDNVVQANKYVPSIPELKEAAFKCRRIGIGIMGLADMLYHVKVRYGSKKGAELAGEIMEYIRYHAMLASIDLAKKRGVFPEISGSVYDSKNFKWVPPTPLFGKRDKDFVSEFNRPKIDWSRVTKSILRHGIRNACITTIAPTGTIATAAGCEGYGCEPVFALAHLRHVSDNGKDLVLTYTSPSFEAALDRTDIDSNTKKSIIKRVINSGTCQDIDELPQSIKEVFVVSSDIKPSEHIRMQAALQRFVDNSLSKTCNLPRGSTIQDVEECFMDAWQLGCKGLTVYVAGSRDKIVLETNNEADIKKKKKEEEEEKKQKEETDTKNTMSFSLKDASNNIKVSEKETLFVEKTKRNPINTAPLPKPHFIEIKKKKRPSCLKGYTYERETSLGNVYVTINEDERGNPLEVFVRAGKSGTTIASFCESFGRMITLLLRMETGYHPLSVLTEIIKQNENIGGSQKKGLGRDSNLSIPDCVAKIFLEYYSNKKPKLAVSLSSLSVDNNKKKEAHDVCPKCHECSLIHTEGCKKCFSCDYSRCG